MFRSTGTRHVLCIWLKVGRIVGILTRKDVLPETVEDVHEGLSLLNDADLEFVAPKASVGNPQKEE